MDDDIPLPKNWQLNPQKRVVKESLTTESELKPCPFCGEQPEYQPWAQGHAPEYHWPHQVVHNCKVIGQQMCVRAHTVGLPDTKEAVFQIWNTRSAAMHNKRMSQPAPTMSSRDSGTDSANGGRLRRLVGQAGLKIDENKDCKPNRLGLVYGYENEQKQLRESGELL